MPQQPSQPLPPVDFGVTAADYSRHRAGFPDAFFNRLAGWGIGRPGQRLLDLGTGTGSLARSFARRGCEVSGLDPAPAMLAQAEQLATAEALRVTWIPAQAEATGLDGGSFEVLTAGQCWHWFDRPAAIAEARRLLVPGGRLVIAHFDWVPLPGNVADATEQLIQEHNPDWRLGGGSGMYPQWMPELITGGFRNLETFSFDLDVLYTHADWRGRIRASAGVGASLMPEAVERFDAAHAALLAERFPDPLTVLHRVFAVIAQIP